MKYEKKDFLFLFWWNCFENIFLKKYNNEKHIFEGKNDIHTHISTLYWINNPLKFGLHLFYFYKCALSSFKEHIKIEKYMKMILVFSDDFSYFLCA